MAPCSFSDMLYKSGFGINLGILKIFNHCFGSIIIIFQMRCVHTHIDNAIRIGAESSQCLV